VGDLDLLGAEIAHQPIIDELLERGRHGERRELRGSHGVDHARHVGDRRQAGRLRQAVRQLVAESESAPYHRRNARLVDDVDVEVRQLLGGALHALDGLVHVIVGQLLDGQRHGGHVDAFRHRLVELEHRARRHRGRKDHAHMQAPPGNTLSHAGAPLEHFPEKWIPVFRRKCDQA
jgi:hypothetical protein